MADIFALLAGEENAGGGKITDSKGFEWVPILEKDFRLVSQGLMNGSSNDQTKGFHVDGEYLYVCRQTQINKYKIDGMTLVATISNPSANAISGFHADATDIYTVHSFDGVRKFSKATMTQTAYSTAALTTGTYCLGVEGDATHLYVAANTNMSSMTIKKIAKSNLGAYEAQSGSITPTDASTITAIVLASDATNVYLSGSVSAGGSGLRPIWKIAKSNLAISNIEQSGAGGNSCSSLHVEGGYIYRTSASMLQRTPVSFASGAENLSTRVPFTGPEGVYSHDGKIYVVGRDSIATTTTCICILDPLDNFKLLAKSTLTPLMGQSADAYGLLVDANGIFIGDGTSKQSVHHIKPYGKLVGYEEVI